MYGRKVCPDAWSWADGQEDHMHISYTEQAERAEMYIMAGTAAENGRGKRSPAEGKLN